MRETVESIVIAFVLAFLIRTFEAEAFVIPTGSMAPTLMGRHKDIDCPQCGHRFRLSASEEEADAAAQQFGRPRVQQIVGGVCPICRFPTPVREDLPDDLTNGLDDGRLANTPSYNGDRIIVNKYVYTVQDPDRWDVVVFKFPGDAKTNYIKRLVGLPGEVIRVYQGDLFIGSNQDDSDRSFEIARKPPEKLLAMRQIVHDTDYDPAELYAGGWPLRWQADDGGGPGWQCDAEVQGRIVKQQYSVDAAGDTEWIRYRHLTPDYEQWAFATNQAAGGDNRMRAILSESAVPQLITDFNAYNTRITRDQANSERHLRADPSKLGLHWVGDLMVEADVDIESDQGELLLDLVKGGRHFTCTFDLATGRAVLSVEGSDDYSPAAETRVRGPGRYHVALANCDDRLLVWVDGRLVSFDDSTDYDVEAIYGSRDEIIPRTSETDAGDLAPVGVGARDAKLRVTQLQVWRDIYYIADTWERSHSTGRISDFDDRVDNATLVSLPRDPSLWDAFRQRRQVEFPLGDDQFFVMGDNSPESSDARLWCGQEQQIRGKPGGAYLERRMLIGKALCVYWPHSWNRIPGTPIPFPLFPNVADMRLVR